ncbi:MAG: cation diffusion facilitator family transporter [Phycisphaerae bacterium]
MLHIRHVPRRELNAALLALVVGVVLLLIKFVAYYLTNSSAVFSDALESIVNVLASGFALWSLVFAHQPADSSHPYGHGKAEFLSALFEGGMILLAAVVIAFNAFVAIIDGPEVQRLTAGLLLIGVAGLINGGMGVFLLNRGRRTGSLVLEADGRHLLSDFVTSVFIIVALAAVKVTGWPMLDPLTALLVAAYLAFTATRLLRRSSAGLLDEQDATDDIVIRRILDGHLAAGEDPAAPVICSYHKLRHRHAGRFHWVDFHLRVPAGWNVDQGHRAASVIEYEIEDALETGNATAHIEPCGDTACPRCHPSAKTPQP